MNIELLTKLISLAPVGVGIVEDIMSAVKKRSGLSDVEIFERIGVRDRETLALLLAHKNELEGK